jgi:phosphoserine phosphatase RsbU/P
MQRAHASALFGGFLRLQALCVGVAVASWGIFWAVNQPVTSIRDLFIYVLLQINLTFLMLRPLKVLYEDRKSKYHWPLHLLAMVVVSAVVVVISAAAVYGVNGWHYGFAHFLRNSWKFPFVANMVYAFAFELYIVTACRLRSRNSKLQQTLAIEVAEREVGAAELKQARDIQRGLLPKEIPQLPQFSITGAWEPAREVGGDYYDVIRLTDEKLAICIADVAGKGVSAALLMANVQAAVRAFASETVPPSRVCAQINSVLYTNTAPEKFVTLFYGVLDGNTRTLRYTNAGHPRPLLLRHTGLTTRLENGGALLGVFPDWNYEDSAVRLEPGDLLLLFTDGITEATTLAGEEFGEDRLIAAAQDESGVSLEELQSHVLQEVKQFSSSHLSDDATLLMIGAVSAHETRPALVRNASAIEVIQFAGVQP